MGGLGCNLRKAHDLAHVFVAGKDGEAGSPVEVSAWVEIT